MFVFDWIVNNTWEAILALIGIILGALTGLTITGLIVVLGRTILKKAWAYLQESLVKKLKATALDPDELPPLGRAGSWRAHQKQSHAIAQVVKIINRTLDKVEASFRGEPFSCVTQIALFTQMHTHDFVDRFKEAVVSLDHLEGEFSKQVSLISQEISQRCESFRLQRDALEGEIDVLDLEIAQSLVRFELLKVVKGVWRSFGKQIALYRARRQVSKAEQDVYVQGAEAIVKANQLVRSLVESDIKNQMHHIKTVMGSLEITTQAGFLAVLIDPEEEGHAEACEHFALPAGLTACENGVAARNWMVAQLKSPEIDIPCDDRDDDRVIAELWLTQHVKQVHREGRLPKACPVDPRLLPTPEGFRHSYALWADGVSHRA